MSDLPEGFVTAGHAVLFEEVVTALCDVCDARLGDDDVSDAQSRPGELRSDAHMPSGRGLLVWSRGEERRYQEPPLCPACAAAIGMSALQRWESEEEEG